MMNNELKTPESVEMPAWLNNVPLVHDWCKYNGEIYFASLNFQESEHRQKPIFDLAYCATEAMNEIFLMQRVFSKRFEYPINLSLCQ